MTHHPMTIAELVEALVDAAQPATEPSAAAPVDEQVERILAMVAPELYRRHRLPPDRRPVYLARAEFEDLPTYSWSLPTGVELGKRWRTDANDTPAGRRGPPHWLLGEFVAGPTPNTCRVRWRRIEVRTTLADIEQTLLARGAA